MTIQMAGQRLGKSESTIRRWIKTGKLTAKLIDGAYDISEDAINRLVNGYPDDKAVNSQPESVDQSLISHLRSENEYLKERIQELEQARERSDMITLQLTRQMEQAQRMLEAHESEKRGPWYRRIFRKK
jgi:predicted RNase H-like nuclease (RuvC/YqgF family)